MASALTWSQLITRLLGLVGRGRGGARFADLDAVLDVEIRAEADRNFRGLRIVQDAASAVLSDHVARQAHLLARPGVNGIVARAPNDRAAAHRGFLECAVVRHFGRDLFTSHQCGPFQFESFSGVTPAASRRRATRLTASRQAMTKADRLALTRLGI